MRQCLFVYVLAIHEVTCRCSVRRVCGTSHSNPECEASGLCEEPIVIKQMVPQQFIESLFDFVLIVSPDVRFRRICRSIRVPIAAVFVSIAQTVQMPCLRYAHESGCNWNSDTLHMRL